MVQKKGDDEEKSDEVDEKQHQKLSVDIEDIGKGNDEGVVAEINAIAELQARRSTENEDVPSSWIESISTDDLDHWSNILTVATAFSATCFLASSVFYFQKRKS